MIDADLPHLPFESDPASAVRGRVVFEAADCEGCRQCERVCPSGAIHFGRTSAGLEFSLWHNSCVFCGTCVFYCPTGALSQTADWRLVHRAEKSLDLVEHGVVPNMSCVECGSKALATAPSMTTVAHLVPPIDEEERGHLQARCPKCRIKYLKARAARPTGAAS